VRKMDKNFKKIYMILVLLDLKNELHLDPDQKKIWIKIDQKIRIQIPNDLARRIRICKMVLYLQHCSKRLFT